MQRKTTSPWTMLVPLVALLAACSGTSDEDDSLAPGDTDNADVQTGDVGIDVPVDTGAMCGDGAVNGDEGCDGNAGDATCADVDGISGEVTCAADCTLDYSACAVAACGDDAINGDDECDGAELGGNTCGDFSFAFGELACASDCTVDTSACRSVAMCGDGFTEGTEECDDGNVTDGDGCASDCIAEACGDGIVQPGLNEACDSGSVIITECEDDPERPVGYVTCNADCELEETLCPVPATCGDSIIDLGEACDDGNDTDDDDCSNTCASNVCGDGALSDVEACDGDDIPTSCADLGFSAGTTSCSETCELGVDSCRNVTCGDGFIDGAETCDDGGLESGDGCSRRCQLESCGDGTAIDGVEACDGDDLQELACGDFGLLDGTLACDASCQFDTSSCEIPCGNGAIDDGEQCDGIDLQGQTCGDFDMMGDALACDSACQYDTSACEEIPCGNGDVAVDEQCDDGNRIDGDGCSATCEVECPTDQIENVTLADLGTIMVDLVAHGDDTFSFVGCEGGFAQLHLIADTDDLEVTIAEDGVVDPIATGVPFERNGLWHYELSAPALDQGVAYTVSVEPGAPICALYDVVFNRTCDTNCDGVDNEDADDLIETGYQYDFTFQPFGSEIFINDIEHLSGTVSSLGSGGLDIYPSFSAPDATILAWVDGERLEISASETFGNHSTNFSDMPVTTDVILVPGTDSCTPYYVYTNFNECAAGEEGSDFPPSFPVNGGTMSDVIIGSDYTIGVDMCDGGNGTLSVVSTTPGFTANIDIDADETYHVDVLLPFMFAVTNPGDVRLTVHNPESCTLADVTLVTDCPCVDDGRDNHTFGDAVTVGFGSFIQLRGIALVGDDGVPVPDYFQVHEPNQEQGLCDADFVLSLNSYGSTDGFVFQLLDAVGDAIGEPFSLDDSPRIILEDPEARYFVSVVGNGADTCRSYDVEVNAYCDFGIDGK